MPLSIYTSLTLSLFVSSPIRQPVDKACCCQQRLLQASLCHSPTASTMAPLQISSPVNMAAMCLILGLTYYIGSMIYELFFSPLASFPGPLLNRMSSIPRNYRLTRGDLPFHVAQLHAKYGPIVRVAPNELAFSTPQAWKDIYGHRTDGRPEFPKWDGFYRVLDLVPRNIITAHREEHAQVRRQLAHGFSERSMRAQEPIMGSYVDLLIQRMHENVAKGNSTLDMREWLNWTTFDVIGDLGFGSPFGCLETSAYHPWIRLITDSIKQGAFFQALAQVGLRRPVKWAAKYGGMAESKHQAIVGEKVAQRMELGAERPDFIEGLIKKKEDLWSGQGHEAQFEMLKVNASLIIIAGSETTATLLSGATFLLTTHPNILRKAADEVRDTFRNEEEITLSSVNSLTYVLAVLNESLRHYPPVATGLPRVTPRGGGTIAGHFVPEGTVVAVWQWAINHDPTLWTEPEAFAPERWMGDERFKGDQLDAMQPFSVGPRNCIGRNLAYAEMRLILARILYNFDMTLAPSSRDWLSTQKAYVLWDKPELNVHLTPVKR
ncbi:cytochrome P450 ClCP1 [Xylariaceae sp. FL0016]|nr:cytochrome P450 ClCP1 [Xylariaceae sp. FL0016]